MYFVKTARVLDKVPVIQKWQPWNKLFFPIMKLLEIQLSNFLRGIFPESPKKSEYEKKSQMIIIICISLIFDAESCFSWRCGWHWNSRCCCIAVWTVIKDTYRGQISCTICLQCCWLLLARIRSSQCLDTYRGCSRSSLDI